MVSFINLLSNAWPKYLFEKSIHWEFSIQSQNYQRHTSKHISIGVEND